MNEKTNSFCSTEMMSWMGFFSNRMNVSPEKIHLMNICDKKKNVIPLIESHKRVIVFADERNRDFCYELWVAGLGECKVWYGFGTAPGVEITESIVKNMAGMEITGPTVFYIMNPHTRESYRIGIRNENFSRGPIRYVGREIRAVIMSMLDVDRQDVICIVSGESIVIEAAIAASEGTIIAVEPDEGSKNSMTENVAKFGVHNVEIVGEIEEDTLKELPRPRLAFLVASEHLEQEIRYLLAKNEQMQFIIYTLELDELIQIRTLFDKYGIKTLEVLQIAVSKTNKNSVFVSQPVPWLISGEKRAEKGTEA